MTHVAIIGAGPYGLSIAAHLRPLDLPYVIFGTPIDTWRHHMPAGMTLKSDGFASNLSDPRGEATLAAYCAANDIPYHDTDIRVPLEAFTAYALEFQRREVPDVDEREVVHVAKLEGGGFSIRLDDGEILEADFVVVAVGITHFRKLPRELAHLSPELVTHSSAHHDLSTFSGTDVIVVGGGSSAVDLAVLLREAGAATSLIARAEALHFDPPPRVGTRSLRQRARRPSSGLGPGWKSWLCQNAPELFRFIPGNTRMKIIRRHLGPGSPWHMKGRIEAGVEVILGESIERATGENDRVRLMLRRLDGSHHEVVADHIVAATGYQPDLRRLEFLDESLRLEIRTHEQMPVLSRHFESTVPDLYFVGLAAVNSFGPLVRFMVGAEFAAPRVARRLARQARRAGEPARRMVPA